jgi:hypothetical protein
MTKRITILTVLAATLGLTGCLVEDTTHRIYLSPTGAIAWTVREEAVQSDNADRAERQREEQEWLEAVARDDHPVADALRRLHPDRISTVILRSERPYAAATEGRFDRIDRVVTTMLEELGLRGSARLEADGPTTTLTVAIDVSGLDEAGSDTPVTALLEDVDHYRVELTDGRFVAATGFDIVRNGTAAVPRVAADEAVPADGMLIFRLAWTVR